MSRRSDPPADTGDTQSYAYNPTAELLTDTTAVAEAAECANDLRNCCSGDNVDPFMVEYCLDMCRDKHSLVRRTLQECDQSEAPLAELTILNETMVEVISLAEHLLADPAPATPQRNPSSIPATPKRTSPSLPITPELKRLVKKKDVLCLICYLQGGRGDQCIDSALALMRFARDAERADNDDANKLRDEICSCGGMHALLEVFRSKKASHELRVVTSLAVVYLLPACLPSDDDPPSRPSIEENKRNMKTGLHVVDCLRYLFSATPVTPRGEAIGREASSRASVMGMYIFWSRGLSPLLRTALSLNVTSSFGDDSATTLVRPSLMTQRSRAMQQQAAPRVFGEHRDVMKLQKLLQQTVSLIVEMAKTSDSYANVELMQQHVPFIVEEMCAVDMARPIVVRQGLLKILAEWMRSQDSKKIRCAVISLSELTSTADSYVAGWIHTLVVNEGALSEIVQLSISNRVGHDEVGVAVAKTLLSLCRAPHIRAAVVEANGVSCLVKFLFELGDSACREAAFVAGSALIRIMKGAAVQSRSSFGMPLDGSALPSVPPDIISDLVNGGVIGQIVEITSVGSRKLRAMAVEALRVLSEDTHKTRNTRRKLCENGAAKAIGGIMNDDVQGNGAEEVLVQVMRRCVEMSPVVDDGLVQELNDVLCAWSNILDPVDRPASSKDREMEEILVRGCIQFVEAGGFESLLCIVTLPFKQIHQNVSENLVESDLMVEACHALASMSPMLLSPGAVSMGHACWSVVALEALAAVFSLVTQDSNGETSSHPTEFQLYTLRGIGSLAKHEPHKLLVVDKVLPSLFHAKSTVGADRLHVADAATQVISLLGFSDDDFTKRVAGNDPQLMGDWFCMQRSLLIQSMARAEICKILSEVWSKPFQEVLQARLLPSIPNNATSGVGAGLLGQSLEEMTEASTAPQTLNDVFTCLKFEAEGLEVRRAIQQYHDVYEERDMNGTDPFSSAVVRRLKFNDRQAISLLSSHVYPLNSTSTEKDWILSHRRVMGDTESAASAYICGTGSLLTDHVQRLLDSYVPSRLIQDDVLPIFDLRPDSYFDFRTLTMPQKRYFSFRREAPLVSQMCERSPSSTESDDVHWTLAFTNSSFAGEFSETLVQALYRCPNIRGLSFTRNENWRSASSTESEDESHDNSSLLADLAVSLPSWVSSVVFDNTLDDSALISLSKAPEELDGLLTGLGDGGESEERYCTETDPGQDRSFDSFAVRNSPHIVGEAWTKFFDVLGRPLHQPLAQGMHPLASLRVLDLSGNELGDRHCSYILKRALDKKSRCCLERLDLSGNKIGQGTLVAKVLQKLHRHNQGGRRSWKAPLTHLNLGSNELNAGTLAAEVVALLNRSSLALKSLDLSNNSLEFHACRFTEVLLGSLVRNTSLCHLNLSGNEFSSRCIDGLLDGLNRSKSESGLAFLLLEDNRPPLSDSQRQSLNRFTGICRSMVLQRHLNDRDRLQSDHRTRMNRERSCDSASLSVEDDEVRRPQMQRDENRITVLYAAPLVFIGEHDGRLHPFAKLDFDAEQDYLWQCLEEARRDITLSFDTATYHRLLAAKTNRSRCLHYSGHGHERHLPFENERGGPRWLEVGDLKRLVEQDEGAPFEFVFVSACHSRLAGETFASAGVPHVVCCKQDSELQDVAALAFTRQFYLALALGRTVKYAFEQGRRAVSAEKAEEEMKFLLLPEDGNHEVPIFDAEPVQEWPQHPHSSMTSLDGASNLELSVRNKIQEDPSPPPPQGFIGREVDLYHVLNSVLSKRLVSVVGEQGVGRSSLVYALCHYINIRKSTMSRAIDSIFFVGATRSRGADNYFVGVLRELLKKLTQDARVTREQDPNHMDIESLIHAICDALSQVRKPLVVIDDTELLEGPDEQQDLLTFLYKVFQKQSVKVLLIGRQPLGVPAICGVHESIYRMEPLDFQNTVSLFSNMCPQFRTHEERQQFVGHLQVVTDEEQSSGATERPRSLFEALGNGIPSRIESAAYSMEWDDIEGLLQ